MARWSMLVVLLFALDTSLHAQAPPAQKTGKESNENKSKAGSDQSKGTPNGTLSEAERIVRLQETIAADQKLRDFLKKKLEESAAVVKKSGQEFLALDTQVKEKNQQLLKFKDAKKDDEAKKLGLALKDLQKQLDLSKERLDLVVQERKVIQERVNALEQKTLLNRQELDRLTGAANSKTGPETAKTPDTKSPAKTDAGPPKKDEDLPKELVTARKEAKEKEALAQQAERDAQSIAERTKAMQKLVDLQVKLLETARKKADIANAAQEQFRRELQKKTKDGAPQAVIQEIWRKIGEADQQATEARMEVRERTDRLNRLHGELTILNQEQILALQEAERTRGEVAEAKAKLGHLENPFAPANMLRWLALHGPKILFIVLGMLGSLLLLRLADNRMISLLAKRSSQKSQEERENRAKTLVAVFHNTAWLVILSAGVMMILDETGIPIVPLMGGAAVLGLAVAFGAQNLIRDYFIGFVILVENQYGINDVVKIGNFAGLVEQITLRITVLRDLDGSVHFIPHGQVSTVTNMTHQWSRALFDVGVAYREDVDRVMAVLMDLGKELLQDAQFGDMILENPEMLGVETLGDSAVVIRFFIKTRPLKQWTVKRELMRRIKNKFDELGIVIPFPQQTVHVQWKDGAAMDPRQAQAIAKAFGSRTN